MTRCVAFAFVCALLVTAGVNGQTPVLSVEAAGRNGQDFRSLACITADNCPGNAACGPKQCILPEDCPGSSCVAGTCAGTYCTTATMLSAADGDIAPGDEIKVEFYLREWDSDFSTGLCQDGSSCMVPANDCAGMHCEDDPTQACDAAADCTAAGVGGACVPDFCQPSPRVSMVRLKLDEGSLVSSGGATSGTLDYVEIPCVPAQCIPLEGVATSCACYHGNRFSLSCTCFQAGVCDPIENLCENVGVGYIETSRPDYLLAGRFPAAAEVTYPELSGWEYFLQSQDFAGVVDTLDGEKRYLGTVHLQLSDGLASGQFHIDVTNNPGETFVADEDLLPFDSLARESLFIDLGPSPCEPDPCPGLGEECRINQCVPTGEASYTCTPVDLEGPCTEDGDLCTLDVCEMGTCSHPPVICAPPSECDPADGICKVLQECTAIVSRNPPNCSIDAGQPHPVYDAVPLQGRTAVELTFNDDCAGLSAADFTVSLAPGGLPVPTISSVAGPANVITITFDAPIPAERWTCLTHNDSGDEVCVGFLPGDVNGSRGTNVADITALIDSLNGVIPRPLQSTDCNRSGAANVSDITCLIDLLNGAEAFDPWNAKSISFVCPTAP